LRHTGAPSYHTGDLLRGRVAAPYIPEAVSSTRYVAGVVKCIKKRPFTVLHKQAIAAKSDVEVDKKRLIYSGVLLLLAS